MTEAKVPPSKTEHISKAKSSSPSTWFQLPPALRRVFDKFPLQTHAANLPPQGSPRNRGRNVLYLFPSVDGTADGSPSCNPSCLKWQVCWDDTELMSELTMKAYLKFQSIDFDTRASNNHSSPTGALPFLLRASLPSERPSSPVSSNKIAKWATSQNGQDDKLHTKEEAYISLLDHTIRNAWLYNMYLEPENFDSVAWPLYIKTDSSNTFVQQALAYQLKSAARDELLKPYATIDAHDIYTRAGKAFESLSALLGDDDYFFGIAEPSLFDASVFAYTHLLLDERMRWKHESLGQALESNNNLVDHRNRVLERFFDK